MGTMKRHIHSSKYRSHHLHEPAPMIRMKKLPPHACMSVKALDGGIDAVKCLQPIFQAQVASLQPPLQTTHERVDAGNPSWRTMPRRDLTRHSPPLIYARVSLRRIAGLEVAHCPVDTLLQNPHTWLSCPNQQGWLLIVRMKRLLPPQLRSH
jgi:hypothetical protein